MTEKYSRHLGFKSVSNFRDIGGYKTRNGKTVAWRRLFRSGDLRHMTQGDYKRLKEEIRLATVIDLRSDFEIKRQGVGLLAQADIRYHNIPFITDDDDPKANERRYKDLKNMCEFYIEQARQKEYGKHIIEALEVIAEPENHPLVFHCAVGKDRTGMLAAILLNLLGVEKMILSRTIRSPSLIWTNCWQDLKIIPKKATPRWIFLIISGKPRRNPWRCF